MTLGNDPQPLTRRQARELAQGHEPASADPQQAPAHLPTHSSGTTPTQPETAQPETAQPEVLTPGAASAFAPPVVAPLETKPGWVAAVSPPRQPVPERTLTRRELRSLQLAQSHEDEPDRQAPAPVSTSLAATDTPAAVQARQPAPVEFLVESTSAKTGRARAGVLHPPVGHWSLDRDEDDGSIPAAAPVEPFDQLMSRGISAGGIPTTTNALILPSIPHQGTTSGPLTSTGEIMITGSIDLPRSLGSTGAHPNLFDSADMDHMLDQLDEGGHHSDVAPVSASRAVSTHASTRNVMAPPTKRGVTLPTVLTITVGVLALGVVALFIAGYVFKIFQ